MPVSLDEMMREVAPERRSEIETHAAALTADFRQRIGRIVRPEAGTGRELDGNSGCLEAGLTDSSDPSPSS